MPIRKDGQRLSKSTVLEKMKLKNNAELTRYAIKNGLA